MKTCFLMAALFIQAFAAAAQADSSCRLALTDTLNKFTTILNVQPAKAGAGEAEAYTVIDLFNNGSAKAVSMRAAFAPSQEYRGELALVSDGAVPATPKARILSDYAAKVASLRKDGMLRENAQLIWIIERGSKCTDLELALMQFYVNEWFYFG